MSTDKNKKPSNRVSYVGLRLEAQAEAIAYSLLKGITLKTIADEYQVSYNKLKEFKRTPIFKTALDKCLRIFKEEVF